MAWTPCKFCAEDGKLHVLLMGVDPSEVINMPTPLLWFAWTVALGLHQEHVGHLLEVAHLHFSILLTYIMEVVLEGMDSEENATTARGSFIAWLIVKRNRLMELTEQ